VTESALRTAVVRPLPARRAVLGLVGPAFVTGIAYVDPGNFAANVAAGSRYGYGLLWVVVLANAIAIGAQGLSAKLGIATGRSLPELCRDRLPRPLAILLWGQAELVAIATDLAEVVGGALALDLLFGLPLLAGGLVTGAAALVLLTLRSRDRRGFEVAVAGLFAVILGAFLLETMRARPSAGEAVQGLMPAFAGSDSVLLAGAILGATIMPHAVYLHSSLTCRRGRGLHPAHRWRVQRIDLAVAMGLAGAVNIAMLLVAAAVLRGRSASTISAVHGELARALGGSAAFVFAVALLASGLASSGVGTLAGEVMMAGFLRRRVPRIVRRLVTLTPSLVVLACGVPVTTALVLSQVALSFGIPFALVPLVAFTANRALMGDLVNRRSVTRVAVVAVAAIAAVNGFLIVQTIA
jgi:manganese transport protein